MAEPQTNPDIIEISKADFGVYQKSKELLDKLWNSPEHGSEFKRTLKKVQPELRIPEIDVVDAATKPINDKFTEQEKRFEALQKRLDEKEQKEKDEKEEAALHKDMDAVKKKYSLTEDGMNKVIERMKEKKAYDPEAAAAWVVAQQPKAEPVKESKLGLPGKMNLYGAGTKDKADETWKALQTDPMQYFDSTVEDVFNNPENYKEFGGAL